MSDLEPMTTEENHFIGEPSDHIFCVKDKANLIIYHRKRQKGLGSFRLWLRCPTCGLEVIDGSP